jgi:hypothetical protein
MTTVIGNDFHFPFEDKKAVKCFNSLISLIQPNNVILNGDLLDNYNISRFDRNPNRKENLQYELDKVVEFLTKLRDKHQGKIVYLFGNHESRMERYLHSQAKELSSLRCLELPQLLELDKLDIEWRPYGEPYHLNKNTLITHGTTVRAKAGYSGSAESLKHGNFNGVSGHVHRLGINYYKTYRGNSFWIENGCLCKLDQDYINPFTVDWQQGCSVLTEIGNLTVPELVPINNGIAYYRGSKL